MNDYKEMVMSAQARTVYIVLLLIIVILALVSMYYTNSNLGLWRGVVDNGVDRYNADKAKFIGAAGAGSAMSALNSQSALANFAGYPGAIANRFRSKRSGFASTGGNMNDQGGPADVVAANAADDYASLLATTSYTGAQVNTGYGGAHVEDGLYSF
jgi:hypothetical protein